MTRIHTYFIIICLIFITHASVSAQNTKHGNKFLEYIIEGNDTIYVDKIAAARIYSKLPRQKGREWRKYYRLVYNFNKTYPYAMVAKSLVEETDRTIEEKKLKGAKRDRYIQQKADEVTLEMMEYIAKEPLIKYILTGHQHFDFESVYAERVPQIVTGIETARVIEFV